MPGDPEHVATAIVADQEVKVEDVEVALEPPPPPPQEVASVAQTASGGPVGQVAGRGGSRNDTAGEADISSYLGLVVAHLRRFKRYPAEAQAANVQGTARVTFSVGTKGADPHYCGLRRQAPRRGGGRHGLPRRALPADPT